MPCRTIVPEHTAYSGVLPGAEMSTPWSGDHSLGGAAALLGSGNVKPPADTGPEPVAGGGDAPDEPDTRDAPDDAGAERLASAACAASTCAS